MAAAAPSPRERRPSTSAPLSDFKGPVGPEGFTRPKHKRTVTGFGPGEIKSVEASIPEPQREAWRKFVSLCSPFSRLRGNCLYTVHSVG